MSKITRFLQKVFASDYAATPTNKIAEFGSLTAGTPTYSGDPVVIQSLDKWTKGFNAAFMPGTNTSPTWQDFNGLMYVITKQLANIGEMGVQEWLATQTYWVGSIVNSGGSLYYSTQDNNINQAVSNPTYWQPIIAPPAPPSTFNSYPAKGGTPGTSLMDIDGVNHKLPLFTPIINPYGQWNNSLQRYQVPVTGVYNVSATTQFDNSTGNAAGMEVGIGLFRNGFFVGETLGTSVDVANPTGQRWSPGFSGLVTANAGDYLELWAFANDGINTGKIALTTAALSVNRVS